MNKALLAGLLLLLWSFPVLSQPDLAQQSSSRATKTTAVHISPNGQYLAVREIEYFYIDDSPVLIADGSTLRVWEISSGKLQWEKKSPINHQRPLLFSPDSKTLLSYGAQLIREGGRTRSATHHFAALDVATGETRFYLELVAGEQIGSMVFTADGKTLLGNTFGKLPGPDGQISQRPAVKEWDSTTGKLLRTIGEDLKAATTGDWQLAANLIAARGMINRNNQMESTIFIWALPDFSAVSSLDLGGGNSSRFALSPGGKRVTYNFYSNDNLGLTNEQFSLWNIEEKVSIPLVMPHDAHNGVLNFGFSPDGKTLIGSGFAFEQVTFQKTQFWFWDAQTGELKETRTVAERSLEVGEHSPQVHLLPDGRSYLFFAQDKKPELRKLEDKSLVRVFE